MADGLTFSCKCGEVQGHLSVAARKAGTRVQCFCADCRAAEIHLTQRDPAPHPVDLFQTTPDGLHITQGADNLRLLRLSPRGLMRWYAGCCGTPIGNTLGKPGLPFVGLNSHLFTDPASLGKVRAKAFISRPGQPPRSKGAGRMAFGIVTRMITSRLSGRWRETPFFDVESGAPVAEAEVLSKKARDALLR